MNTFSHRGSNGDIIYALPAIIASGGGILNIVKKQHYDMLHNLLMLQPNLEVRHGYEGLSLDSYRKINDNKKHLAQCHLEAINVSYDLTRPWLFNIEPVTESEIVVNRTRHYHDKKEIDWRMFEEYADKTLFIGLEDEFAVFKKRFAPNVKLYKKCKDALEMAQIIKGSKLFVGNQSLAFALAEAMKHPRILEICYRYDNCRPQGENGHTYLTNALINEYVNS